MRTCIRPIDAIGGGGNAPTIDSTKGYYGLTTANANVFTQTASTGPSGYLSTFIRVIVKSNGTQGATTNLANSWGTITLTGTVSGL